MTGDFTLAKSERLFYRSQIDALFKTGLSFNLSPFKIVYRLFEVTDRPGVKILITVPRKRFKRAVDRNHMKRIIREAYRLNKHILANASVLCCMELHLGFVYTGITADLSFAEMQDALVRCLEKIKKIAENEAIANPVQKPSPGG